MLTSGYMDLGSFSFVHAQALVEGRVDGIDDIKSIGRERPLPMAQMPMAQFAQLAFSRPENPAAARPAESRKSYLDYAAHEATSAFGRLVLKESPEESKNHSDAEKYEKMFLTSVPLFLSRRGAVSLTAGMFALNEASPDESLRTQATDMTLGGLKGASLKLTLAGMSTLKGSPAMKGVSLGLADRSVQATLTRQNWIDPRTGEFSGRLGAFNTVQQAGNLRALATDAVLFGATEFVVGKLNYMSKGAFYRNPILPLIASGGIFGISTGAAEEVTRQQKAGEDFSLSKVMYRAGMSGSVTALASSVGGIDRARSLRIDYSKAETRGFFQENSRPVPERVAQFNRLDAGQIELKSSPMTIVKQLNDVAYLAEVAVPNAAPKPVVFRLTETPEMRARYANELLEYRLHRALKPGTSSRTVVDAEAVINNQRRPGYLQEIKGGSLEDALRSMASAREGLVTDRATARSLSGDKLLYNQYEKLWVERMLMQEWDNHAHNMLKDGKQLSNIDFADALPAAKYRTDLVPTWGKTVSQVSLLNDRLIGQFSGKPLSVETHSMLKDFVTDFNTPAGMTALGAAGHSRAQVTGLMGRAQWFVESGKMPTRDVPNLAVQASLRTLYLLRKGQSQRFEKEPLANPAQ